jgi:preprotein translocase subunit YajC
LTIGQKNSIRNIMNKTKKLNHIIVLSILFGAGLSFAQDSAVPSLPPPVAGAGTVATAEQAAGAAAAVTTVPGAPASGSPWFMIFTMVGMFVLLYFFSIRPQQKKQQEQEELLKGLKAGDEVVTQSGILGKIIGMTDKVVTLEVATNVKIKVIRSRVANVIRDPQKDLVLN